jgi:hypothetical protein
MYYDIPFNNSNIHSTFQNTKFMRLNINSDETAQSEKRMATGWTTGVLFTAGAGIFLSNLVQTSFGVNPVSCPMVSDAFPSGRESGQSSPSRVDVTNVWSHTSTPHYAVTGWFLSPRAILYIFTSCFVCL